MVSPERALLPHSTFQAVLEEPKPRLTQFVSRAHNSLIVGNLCEVPQIAPALSASVYQRLEDMAGISPESRRNRKLYTRNCISKIVRPLYRALANSSHVRYAIELHGLFRLANISLQPRKP